MENKHSPPIKKFRTSVLSVAIWENIATNKKTEEPVKFHTISTDRRYKDKEGNWKSTGTLKVNDIPKMRVLLAKAYEYLIMKGATGGSNSEVPPVDEEEIVM